MRIANLAGVMCNKVERIGPPNNTFDRNGGLFSLAADAKREGWTLQ